MEAGAKTMGVQGVLDGDKLAAVLGMENAIRCMERALLAKPDGRLTSPPRYFVQIPTGSLTITGGGMKGDDAVVGFNSSVWVGKSTKSLPEAGSLAVVFDGRSGELKAAILSKGLTSLRTPAISAVALKYLARPDAVHASVLGAGAMARLMLEAAATARKLESVAVYSPTAVHREEFAEEMGARLRLPIEPVSSAEEAVRRADILICCTTSHDPIFHSDWLRPGVHIVSVGPKYREAHEVPVEAAARSAVIATDTFAGMEGRQMSHLGPYYLIGTPHRARIVELSDIMVGKQPGRRSDDDITLFSPVGLAGAEIVLAAEAVRVASEGEVGEQPPS